MCGSSIIEAPLTKKRVRMVGGSTREEAERTFAERKVKELREPVLNRADHDLTLRAYAERWLTLVKPHLAQRTHLSYTQQLTVHVWPTLGTVKLRELRRRDIAALLADKRLTLGRNTVRLIKAALSVLLAHAVESEVISANVAQGTFRAQGKASKGSLVRAMSLDQLTQFKQTTMQMQEDGLLSLPLSMLFLTMAGTGLRPSEALALQQGDVDLSRQRLRIERALDDDGSDKVTKTDEAREVDLSDQLTVLLRAYVVYLRAEAMASGEAPVRLFPGLTTSHVRNAFQRVLTQAALPHFSPYDLRHTYASLLLSANVPLLYVSQQLGHRQSTMTLKHYARWMPGKEQNFSNLLDSGCQTWHQTLAPNAEVLDSTGEAGIKPVIDNHARVLFACTKRHERIFS